MLARTAFGAWGSAQRGPSATQEAPKACAERTIVPTLPGSRDAVQVHAQRPDGRAPALLVDGEHARARAERGDARERRRLDLVEAAARRARVPAAGSPRAARGPPACAATMRSSPSAMKVPLRSRSRRRCRRRRAFRRGFWAEDDGGHGVVWSGSCLVVGAGCSGKSRRAPFPRSGATPVEAVVCGLGAADRARAQAADASRAASAKRRKVSASRTAMSASTLRSSSIPASERPCMNCE